MSLYKWPPVYIWLEKCQHKSKKNTSREAVDNAFFWLKLSYTEIELEEAPGQTAGARCACNIGYSENKCYL